MSTFSTQAQYVIGLHQVIGFPTLDHLKLLFAEVNKKTFGSLIKSLKLMEMTPENLEETLGIALEERNYLAHEFFRKHNLRIFSETGRDVMIADLERAYSILFNAYVTLMKWTGVEITNFPGDDYEAKHLPI